MRGEDRGVRSPAMPIEHRNWYRLNLAAIWNRRWSLRWRTTIKGVHHIKNSTMIEDLSIRAQPYMSWCGGWL
jgi:hypothetical protein